MADSFRQRLDERLWRGLEATRIYSTNQADVTLTAEEIIALRALLADNARQQHEDSSRG